MDYLRTFHSVFISYDRRLSIFKILTNDVDGLEKVEEVITKLRTAFCECAALRSVPLDVYLARPPEPNEVKAAVRMVESKPSLAAEVLPPTGSATTLGGFLKTAELAGAEIPQEEKLKWNVKAAKVAARNQRLIERALLRTLKRLVYTRGRIQMRAHFGLFVFSKHMSLSDGREILTVEFMNSISDSKTKGSLQQVYVRFTTRTRVHG